MHNTRHGNLATEYVTQDVGLQAARKAAHRFTMGAARDTQEDAAQDAQLAVLEAIRAGKQGTFGYFYGVAFHRLMDLKRANKRRQAREYAYEERHYGIDAVNPQPQDAI